MKNSIKVILVIIGSFIGAGFASGQEMNIFFFKYGIKGIVGIILSCILISIVIYKTLCIIKKYNIESFEKLLKIIFNKKFVCVLNIIINILMLLIFYIMVAGFGAYFEQELRLNSIIGSIILALMCYFVFINNVKGLIKVNEILVPFLILFIFLIGFLNFKSINFLEINQYLYIAKSNMWILDSIVYSSYNLILIIPVLTTLNKMMNDKREFFLISIIVGIIILLLAIIIFSLLIKIDVNINNLEMPVVYVIRNCYKKINFLYGFVILSSIFTTTISVGTTFLQNITKNSKGYSQIALIMCITSVGISKFGFSNLTKLLYPIFGYIGIIEIIKILKIKTKFIN